MLSSQIHFSSNPNQKSLTHDWLLKFSSRLCWHLGRDEWWRSRRRGGLQNCLWKLQKIYTLRDVSSILENLLRPAANANITDCWIHWKWSFHSTWGPQDISQPAARFVGRQTDLILSSFIQPLALCATILQHGRSDWVWNPKISPSPPLPQKDLTTAIDKVKAPLSPFSINARASKYVKRTSHPRKEFLVPSTELRKRPSTQARPGREDKQEPDDTSKATMCHVSSNRSWTIPTILWSF